MPAKPTKYGIKVTFCVYLGSKGHQGVRLGDFKELLVEQLIGGNSFFVHFNREYFHYPVKTSIHRNCI